jgi:hypothetical protein
MCRSGILFYIKYISLIMFLYTASLILYYHAPFSVNKKHVYINYEDFRKARGSVNSYCNITWIFIWQKPRRA